MAKKSFKKRYVLGKGYPWAIGLRDYKLIGILKKNKGVNYIILNWPDELWSEKLPKYRLVLERVSNGKKK